MQGNEIVSAKVKARRKLLLEYLTSSTEPISGTSLSKRLSVSRQIIVQDIAAIKEGGVEILSTRMGYLIPKKSYFERVFKVWHTREQTEDELATFTL
jgi:transcriptional regulator of NAD metabolism